MTQIKLSQQTIAVLRNYATINSSIVIRKGNQLKTISIGENAVAKYICEEEFPQDFAIYDLTKFLSGISLFSDPILTFGDPNYVLITGQGKSIKYYFSDPEITLKSAPDKDIRFPETDIEFKLSNEDITSFLKAHGIYEIDDLKFSSQDGQIVLTLCDKEDETSNTYSQVVSGETTGDYEMFMKVENIRLVPGEYNVKISSKLITEWKHSNLDLTYYIALEP
jgi:hypothetical protein